jgi:L-malate glycosyltransferase
MTMARRTRVVYVNHTGAVSGAERILINMVRGLDRELFEPFVLCPAQGELARLLKAEGIACVDSPAVQARFTWRPNELWKAVVSLVRAIAALRTALSWLDPDIVHANTLRAGIAVSMAAIGTNRTVVWHIHDNLPRHPLSVAVRFAVLFLRPARVIAVSDSTAKSFCGPFAFTGKVSTIHNGTDLSQFPLKSADSLSLRTALEVPEDAFLVCAVGQICARKGLVELVMAFEQAHAQAPQMHLVIAGSVVFEHEKRYLGLLRIAAAAPQIAEHVHFTGHLHNVSALLQAADLLVLNSYEEPFGLVLVEAMSSGTPVLATRVGGIPEIVRDEENGWLVEKADTDGLARKLVELSLNKGKLELAAQRARESTCPQFSLEKFHKKLQVFYAELTPNGKSVMEPAQSISPQCH